ncbi:MAG: hypothetical protein LBE55_05730, partial [Clostridiales bacterium]|nr:hypothetical protein [Clostridiales bacterium]
RHFEGERPALPVNLNPDLPPYHMRMFGLANRSWRLGILFSDGTVLRRSGSGFSGLGDFFPPDGQFDILNDFIMTIGTEIQERHAAEAAQSE